MAHLYGGILGILAFLTTIGRGVIHGSDPQSILWSGWLSLILFSIVGLIIGWIAGTIIEESTIAKLVAEMAAQDEEETENQQ